MINLHSKFADKLPEFFSAKSIVAGRLNQNYDFTGIKTMKLTIPQTVPLNDYKREGMNRYGEPQEVQDTVQELTMTQDRSFTMTVDKGNNTEQGMLKSAGRMLKMEIEQRCIPESDRYTLAVLANKAGTIVQVAAPTKETIADMISDGTAVLDEAEVPENNRTLFITPEIYKLLKHSPLFVNNNELGKAVVAKGQVGEYDNMPVVKALSSRMPEHVLFLIVHRDACCAPVKLSETKLHRDPPGISGNLMEGRFIYDAFVLEPTAKGIYVAVDKAAAVCKAPAIDAAAGTITADGGSTAYFTTDGSDPRYSASAQQGTAPAVSAGMTVKAYCTKKDGFASPVAEVKITG